jgi:lipid A 3-O-deacylase
MKLISSLAFVLGLAFVQPVFAGDLVDEVRLGGGGLLQGDSSKDRGVVGSAEIYLAPFKTSRTGISAVLLEPRIQLGVSGGPDATDQAYAGLNWHVPLGETFFAEAGFGGTVHNGSLDTGDRPHLGCRFLFREHVALGMRLTETVNLMATADHSSHANLCDGPNDGLTHVGLAVGVKF